MKVFKINYKRYIIWINWFIFLFVCKIIINNIKIKSYIKYVFNIVVWGFFDFVDIIFGFMLIGVFEKLLDVVIGIFVKMLLVIVV